jgi:uncharacterized protein
MNKYFILLLVGFTCFGQNPEFEKAMQLPHIGRYINDFEDLLGLPDEINLQNTVKTFAKSKETGIVVVTTESFGPYETISDYSLAMANQTSFSCVMIVVSRNLQQVHIQTCDDIAQKLTDGETKAIIDNYMIPEFKRGNYYRGLVDGIAEIKKEL